MTVVVDYSAVGVVTLWYRAARCDEKIAPEKPADNVRCPTGVAYHPTSTTFRLDWSATLADGLGCSEVIGCGAI